MDVKQLARIIQQRLGLEDQEFSLIRENPKFQHLFENATKGARKKKVILFTTSGTPPRHPKIQSIYEKSLPEEIRKEIKYFPLHGRMSRENLTLFDKFLITIGKIMEQDETLKKDMGKDFDGVQRENLLPLLEYLEDVKRIGDDGFNYKSG